MTMGWNRGGAAIFPQIQSAVGTDVNRKARRPRGQEKVSHQWGGYADIPSLEWLRKCAGESWLINWREGAKSAAESMQHSPPPRLKVNKPLGTEKRSQEGEERAQAFSSSFEGRPMSGTAHPQHVSILPRAWHIQLQNLKEICDAARRER